MLSNSSWHGFLTAAGLVFAGFFVVYFRLPLPSED
jgi:hypothetical protein